MAQDARDIQDAEAANTELLSGADDSIPSVIAGRLVLGEKHPSKVWREYRSFTQESLGT